MALSPAVRLGTPADLRPNRFGRPAIPLVADFSPIQSYRGVKLSR
jgi:hypothetical protein